MVSPFRELSAAQVAEISARNRASRVHKLGDESPPSDAMAVPSRKSSKPGKRGPDQQKRKKVNLHPTEHQEQQKLIQWWDEIAAPQRNVWHKLLFAIPNSSKLSDYGRVWKWAEGLRSGVPDLMLAVPHPFKTHAGLFIEMKRVKGGKATQEQSQFRDRLIEAGYACVICQGFEEAKRAIEEYLG